MGEHGEPEDGCRADAGERDRMEEEDDYVG